MKLNLGCGSDIKEGFVNIDHRRGPGVDLVCDMHRLPFSRESVEHVFSSHSLEHCMNWEDVIIEIHRVLKPGGTFELHVPYGFQPRAGHRASFDERTMDFFLAQGDISSCDDRVSFDLVRWGYRRRTPFRWHLKRYLGIELPYNAPIGKRWEIYWIMKRR